MKLSIQLTSGQEIQWEITKVNNIDELAKALQIGRYVTMTAGGKGVLLPTDKIELIKEL